MHKCKKKKKGLRHACFSATHVLPKSADVLKPKFVHKCNSLAYMDPIYSGESLFFQVHTSKYSASNQFDLDIANCNNWLICL